MTSHTRQRLGGSEVCLYPGGYDCFPLRRENVHETGNKPKAKKGSENVTTSSGKIRRVQSV